MADSRMKRSDALISSLFHLQTCVFEQILVDVKAVAHLFSVPRPQRRMSVGPGLLDEQGANGVIGTGLVEHRHRLLPKDAGRYRQIPCRSIAIAARAERDDDGHRRCRISVGGMCHRHYGCRQGCADRGNGHCGVHGMVFHGLVRHYLTWMPRLAIRVFQCVCSLAMSCASVPGSDNTGVMPRSWK